MSTRCFMADGLPWEEKERPGALWWASDGTGNRHLLARTPDGGVVNISRWTITGTAPDITVTPSIKNLDADGRETWHGSITNGVMAP